MTYLLGTVTNYETVMKLPKDLNRPNRLRFALPISSHVIIPLGSFGIILLFAFMAHLCMVRNMSEKSKEVLSRDSSHDLKWV